MGRRFITLGLGAFLVASAGCSDRDPHAQSTAKGQPPKVGGPANVPAPRAPVPDQVFDRAGRKSLSLDFHGKGTRNTVVYGRFSRNIPLSSSDYEVANLLYPDENPQDIQVGDYGVVILPAMTDERPVALATGEAETIKIVMPADELTECWKPEGKEQAAYVARETAGGVLHFRSGWKWTACGD